MIGDWVLIGGRSWDVLVTDITEEYSILYTENTGRTLDIGAPLTLDPLGTFFSHKVTFARKRGHEADFDELFAYLATPRYSGFPVRIVHGQTTLEYEAYASSGSRKVKRIDDKSDLVKWDTMQISFIPIRAQVVPNA